MNKQNGKIISLIAIICFGILLTLNSYSGNKLSYSLDSEDMRVVENMKSYSPHITLPKGTYTFNISGKGQISLATSDGNILGGGTAGNPFTCKLNKDESYIVICGEEDYSLNNAVIQSTGTVFNDARFITLLMIAGMIFVWYLKYIRKSEIKNRAIYFILTLTAIIASYPVFTFYVQYGNDLNFHLWRIEGIKDGLLNGQFPVRLDPSINNGYGYITSVMYSELFLYIPAFLRILGISAVTAYKTLIVLMNIATAFITYKSVEGISKSSFTAIIASVAYTLCVWRLYNTYYRAALGESLAMVFFPLVVYGIYEIFIGNQRKWWILAVAFTCVIQSHFISSLIITAMTIFCFIVFFKNIRSNGRWISLAKAALLTVLLNLWYIVPFFAMYTNFDMNIQNKPTDVQFFRNAIIPAQLFNIFDNTFGPSLLTPNGINGDISLSPGFGVLACTFTTIYFFIIEKEHKIENKHFHMGLFIFAMLLIFMSTTLFPWELLQKPKLINIVVGTIQFPWRLLSLASPTLIIVGCITAATLIKPENHKKTIAVAVILCTLTCTPFFTAYTTQQGTALEKGKTVDLAGAPGWDNEYFALGTDTDELTSDKYNSSANAKIIKHEKNGTKINLSVNTNSNNAWVEVPLLYYPGYTAKDNNGNSLTVTKGNNNVIRIMLKDNTNSVKIKYSGFWYFKLADSITLLTLCACGIIIYGRRKGKKWSII